MTTAEKLDLIEAYYAGCSSGDVDAMMATLDPDVVHFFLSPNRGDRPVVGARPLALYWQKVQARIDGRWVVDHLIGEGHEAVIEWTLFWTVSGERIATRGSEWYRFRHGRIAEIRAYYEQPDLTSELRDFDYERRGYSTIGEERRSSPAVTAND